MGRGGHAVRGMASKVPPALPLLHTHTQEHTEVPPQTDTHPVLPAGLQSFLLQQLLQHPHLAMHGCRGHHVVAVVIGQVTPGTLTWAASSQGSVARQGGEEGGGEKEAEEGQQKEKW